MMPPRRALSRRLQRAAGALLLLAALGGGTAFADDGKPAPAIDPHYGDSLFDFYQHKYFSAVLSLMVSQHFQRLTLQDDDAELLRASLLLSYGMLDEAGAVFTRLADAHAAPAVRDRAWFYLAKINYQRGYLAAATQAVGRVGAALPPELAEQKLLLQAQLQMAAGDFAGAARLLSAAGGDAARGPYERFNLGVALIGAGDVTGGSAWLDGLGKARTEAEEQRVLRDRANVALGFAALRDQQPEAARGYLQRVRLEGMQSGKALLGYGWAAAALKRPEQALVPWNELLRRGGSDSAALEARLAVPYAYAELGASAQALAHYDAAIAAYRTIDRELDESIAAVRCGDMVKALLDGDGVDEMGWFWQPARVPALPHPEHLAPLLAQHPFQEALKNLRDLRFLSNNLRQWTQTIDVYQDMLANRRDAFARRLPHTRAEVAGVDLSAMRAKRDGLAEALLVAQSQPSGREFFDARQAALLARLDDAEAAAQRLGDGEQAETARQRLRRVAGAMTWELAAQRPSRLWQAHKALAQLDAQLARADGRIAALAAARHLEPQRFEVFASRIAALAQRVRALQPRVAALSGAQQAALQDMAVAELQQRKAALGGYATQARLAIAQLHDRGHAAAPEAEHASR